MKNYIKWNNLVGWGTFVIAFITYTFTIEPTASFWDCGEYIACAYKLEVGHPPGAPFFLIIGRIFSLLGFGNPAHAAMMINIMSATCSALTILFLFWSITRIANKILSNQSKSSLTQYQQLSILAAGTIGALAYTFSDSFWFSAVEGEVYAMSSFFTAIVFWVILKWDEEDSQNPISAMRWLVLIAYLMGLSIGVHLLNLLVIPAICFVYYFKKYTFTWKSFIITGLLSLALLGGIQNMIIPKLVKFAADYEIFFVNKLSMSFNVGTLMYFLLLLSAITLLIIYSVNKIEKYYKIGFYISIVFVFFAVISANGSTGMFMRAVILTGIIYAIHKLKTTNVNLLNVVLVSFTTLIIGYSTFFVLVIRSQANTPMDENDPENAITLLSYLNREQYGDWPLIYGPNYNAPPDQEHFKDGEPVYAKDEKNKKYKIIDSRKKSIPVYDKKYCTYFPRMWSQQGIHEGPYKYWGDVKQHHQNKSIINEQTGEAEIAEIPTLLANITFFINYQIKYMYLRYFAWNFIGRQNDIQGLTNNPLEGNWKTGIAAFDNWRLDTDTTQQLHVAKNNKADNSFYGLPFILGILGFIFMYKNSKQSLWVVSLLFLLTGLAIVIYLNQTPYQPRERDYAYAASFYAFAIWIGFGVLFLFEFLFNKTTAKNALVLSTIIGLTIPTIMAAQGWDDHNRSKRRMSRDFATNYLNSCAPNAILFTNGDNDTFPLWYAQEVEGVRTDIKVVNLSLLQTDWYIKQNLRATYEAPPVPFSIPAEKLVQGTREVIYIVDKGVGPMNLKDAIKMVASDDTQDKLPYGNNYFDYLPTKKFYLDIDTAQVINQKIVSTKDAALITKRIEFELNRSHITKNDLMVLDLIANNNWTRPIYFATTTGSEAYIGLEDYFQLEGLAYRFVPIKKQVDSNLFGERVNETAMYDNLMNKFMWGGLDKKGVYLDETCVRMAANMRIQFATLANALIKKGKKAEAEALVNLCMDKLPDENVRYDGSMYGIILAYYELGKFSKANNLTNKMCDIFLNDLMVYTSQTPSNQTQFRRDTEHIKNLLKQLLFTTEKFGQKKVYESLVAKITSKVSVDDLMGPEDVKEQNK